MKLNFSRFFDLCKYSKRKDSDYFLIETEKHIMKALESGLNLTLFSTYEKNNYEKIQHSDMKKITGNTFVKEVGVCRKFATTIDTTQPFFIFDNLVDYGNIGTIIRTLYAFGFNNVLFIMNKEDFFHHKVFEASRDLFFKVRPGIMSTENALIFIKERELSVITMDLVGESLDTAKLSKDKNVAFIFGNEANGISEEFKQIKARSLFIPINFDSLNVGVATGIFAHKLKNAFN